MQPTPQTEESSEKNRAFFNARREGTNHDAGIRRAQWLVEKLKKVPAKTLAADVGCNNGVYTAMYAKVPGIQVMEGFDFADEPLKEAREVRGIPSKSWRGGVEKCPVETGRYDTIVCAEIIEHIVNTDFFVKELRRILKPGGYLLLTTPNLFFWLNRIKMIFGIIPWDFPGVSSEFKSACGVNPAHIRMSSLDEWAAFFKFHRFEVLETAGIPWVVPTDWKGKIISLIDKLLPKRFQYSCFYLLKKPSE